MFQKSGQVWFGGLWPLSGRGKIFFGKSIAIYTTNKIMKNINTFFLYTCKQRERCSRVLRLTNTRYAASGNANSKFHNFSGIWIENRE